MALEFALRPRFRLDEEVAPAAKPRRQVPAVVLPVLTYWALLAVSAYAFLHSVRSDGVAEEPAEPAAVFAPEVTQPHALQDSVPPAPQEIASLAPLVPLEELGAGASAESDGWEPPPESADVEREPDGEQQAAAEPFEDSERIDEPEPEPRIQLPPRVETFEDTSPRPGAEPAVAPRDVPALGSLPSCEAAAASSSQEVDFAGSRATPDLPREAFAAVLENGAYLSACGIPERSTLDICVAVQHGKVKGVSVSLRPPSAALESCVRRAVAALRFPESSKLDVARTRFDALR